MLKYIIYIYRLMLGYSRLITPDCLFDSGPPAFQIDACGMSEYRSRRCFQVFHFQHNSISKPDCHSRTKDGVGGFLNN